LITNRVGKDVLRLNFGSIMEGRVFILGIRDSTLVSSNISIKFVLIASSLIVYMDEFFAPLRSTISIHGPLVFDILHLEPI